jgi:hypothetical protein
MLTVGVIMVEVNVTQVELQVMTWLLGETVMVGTTAFMPVATV